MSKQIKIQPAAGKLGILTPGMGAVATTFIAGVIAARKGIALPIGSLTQSGTILIGNRTEDRNPKIKDCLPRADHEKVTSGGWSGESYNV